MSGKQLAKGYMTIVPRFDDFSKNLKKEWVAAIKASSSYVEKEAVQQSKDAAKKASKAAGDIIKKDVTSHATKAAKQASKEAVKAAETVIKKELKETAKEATEVAANAAEKVAKEEVKETAISLRSILERYMRTAGTASGTSFGRSFSHAASSAAASVGKSITGTMSVAGTKAGTILGTSLRTAVGRTTSTLVGFLPGASKYRTYGTTAAKQMLTGVRSGGASALLSGVATAGAYTAIYGAMSGISTAGSNAISRLDTLKNYPVIMKSLGYSTDSATDSLTKMDEHIQGLPTTLDDMVSTVSGYAAILGDIDKATEIGISLNDMLLAGGRGTEWANSALEQFRQILSKGKPDLQDWKTLMQAAPGQMNKLAEAIMGTGNDAYDLYAYLGGGAKPDEYESNVEEYQKHMQEFLDAIVRLDKEGGEGFESFETQARAAVAGIGTAMGLLSVRASKAIANVLDNVVGRNAIADKINEISSSFAGMADHATKVGLAIKNNIDWDLITSANGATKSLLETLFPSDDDHAESFGKAIATVINKLAEMEQKSLPALKVFGETFKQVFDWALTNFLEFWRGITDTFDSAALSEAIRSIGDAIGAAFPSDGSTAYNFGVLFTTILNDIIKKVPGAVKAITEFVNGFTEMWLSLSGPRNESIGGIKNSLSSIFGLEGIKDKFKDADLNKVAHGAGVGLANALTEGISKIDDILKPVSEGVKAFRETFDGETFKTNIGDFFKGFAQGLGLVGEEGKEITASDVGKTIATWLNDFGDTLEKLVPLSETFGSGIKTIGTNLDNLIPAVLGAFAGFKLLHGVLTIVSKAKYGEGIPALLYQKGKAKFGGKATTDVAEAVAETGSKSTASKALADAAAGSGSAQTASKTLADVVEKQTEATNELTETLTKTVGAGDSVSVSDTLAKNASGSVNQLRDAQSLEALNKKWTFSTRSAQWTQKLDLSDVDKPVNKMELYSSDELWDMRNRHNKDKLDPWIKEAMGREVADNKTRKADVFNTHLNDYASRGAISDAPSRFSATPTRFSDVQGFARQSGKAAPVDIMDNMVFGESSVAAEAISETTEAGAKKGFSRFLPQLPQIAGLDTLGDVFGTTLRGGATKSFGKAIPIVGEISLAGDLAGILSQLFGGVDENGDGNPLAVFFNEIYEIVKPLNDTLSSFFDNVITPIKEQIFDNLENNPAIQYMLDAFGRLKDAIGVEGSGGLADGLKSIFDFIKPITDTIGTLIGWGLTGIIEAIAGALGVVADVIGSIVGTITDFINLITKGDIVGALGELGTAGIDAIATVFDNLFGTSIKKFWNDNIASITVPVIDWHLPYLADGGVVSRPTLAMIGEGSNSEGVLPLSNNTYDEIANGIARNGGVGVDTEALLDGLAGLMSSMRIVQDGVTTGRVQAPYNDRALGARQRLANRGVAIA